MKAKKDNSSYLIVGIVIALMGAAWMWTSPFASGMGDQIMLDVQDDGIGLDETKQLERRPDGVGLVAMRERANELNGKLMIESAENDGTTIVIEIPL